MKDPAHIADMVVNEALDRFLREYHREPLPGHLGRELLRVMRRRLQRAGINSDEHVQDVFSLAMMDVYNYFNRHAGSGIEQPREWLHEVFRNATNRYIDSIRPKNGAVLTLLLENETDLEESSPIASDESMLALVREAIRDLPARVRTFFQLDLVERLPPEEIQERMGIQNDRYFRKFKGEAFAALLHALQMRIP